MGYTMTAQQPYPDFNKEKITDQSENSVDDKGTVIILGDLNITNKGKNKPFPKVGQDLLNGRLLQSAAMDYTVRYRRL